MIDKVLGPQADRAYALLRIVSGACFAVHGAQKLFGVLGGTIKAAGSQLWFGAIIELIAGPMIALGYFAPYAAFLASGTMAVAYVQYHWKLSFGARFFPSKNGGELALIYAFVFLYIACRGNGVWSLSKR